MKYKLKYTEEIKVKIKWRNTNQNTLKKYKFKYTEEVQVKIHWRSTS